MKTIEVEDQRCHGQDLVSTSQPAVLNDMMGVMIDL